MTLLSKQGILGSSDLLHEDVDVPSWGGTVRVRAMSGKERDELRVIMEESRDTISVVHASLLSVSLVDENGAQLFTASDVDSLRGKCATTLDKLFTVAMRINRMDGAAVDDAAKNSEGDQSADSGSGSP